VPTYPLGPEDACRTLDATRHLVRGFRFAVLDVYDPDAERDLRAQPLENVKLVITASRKLKDEMTDVEVVEERGDDTTYVRDFAYLLHETGRDVQCEYDRHVCGLFRREEWLQTLAEAGFDPHAIPFEHGGGEPGSCEVFLGVKMPGNASCGDMCAYGVTPTRLVR